MTDLISFIKLIPVLMALVRQIEQALLEARIKGTVADHVTKIKEAYAAQDTAKLNDLFNKP